MEAFADYEQSSSSDHEKGEGFDELLEDSWFYENLFNRKTKVLSYSFSDPFPSSSLRSAAKLPEYASPPNRSLVRAPSLPPCIGRKEKQREEDEAKRQEKSMKKIGKLSRQFSERIAIQEPETDPQPKKDQGVQAKESARKRKSSGQTSRSSLQRTQTLPADTRRDDMIEDKESYARLSILIREAMASSSSESTPKRHQTPKGSPAPQSRTPKPPRKSEPENLTPNFVKGSVKNQIPNRRGLQKTVSNLETEMEQGFKVSSPGLDEVYRGFQEKKQERVASQPKLTKRHSLSEALLSQSSEAAIPSWVPKDSSEDLKAKIKFWARAVATNVRQEC